MARTRWPPDWEPLASGPGQAEPGRHRRWVPKTWDPADRSSRRTARTASAESEVRPGPRPPTLRPHHRKSTEAGPEATIHSLPAEYGMYEGAGLRFAGSHRMAGFRGVVDLSCGRRPARSWWRWWRGGPGSATTSCSPCRCGSSGAVPGGLRWPRRPGRFVGRALVCAEARGRSPLCWRPAGPGPVGRWRAGGYALRHMWPARLVAARPMPDRAGDS